MRHRSASARVVGTWVLALLASVGWSASPELAPSTDAGVFVVDLALGKHKHTYDVEPGTFSVRFLNRAPGRPYWFESRTESLLLKPLEMTRTDAGTGEAAIKSLDAKTSPCDALAGAVSALMEPTLEEPAVPGRRLAVERLLVDVRTNLCPGVDAARAAIAATTNEIPVRLADGQEVTMRLCWEVPASEAEIACSAKKWTIELSTIGPGRWLTTFGYSFGGFTGDKDEKFFSKATGEGAFEVAQEDARAGLAYVPTIFYAWIPRGQMRRSVAVGPAAGLGFGSSTPTPMLGLAATWRQNVSLIAGGLLRKVTRLSGAHTVGQTLTENATSDSLQQSVYRPGVFVSVAFRFGSNPFGTSSTPPKDGGSGTTGAAQAEKKRERPAGGR